MLFRPPTVYRARWTHMISSWIQLSTHKKLTARKMLTVLNMIIPNLFSKQIYCFILIILQLDYCLSLSWCEWLDKFHHLAPQIPPSQLTLDSFTALCSAVYCVEGRPGINFYGVNLSINNSTLQTFPSQKRTQVNLLPWNIEHWYVLDQQNRKEDLIT